MAEDPLSPRQPPKSLAERLGSTGSRIAELSKQEDKHGSSKHRVLCIFVGNNQAMKTSHCNENSGKKKSKQKLRRLRRKPAKALFQNRRTGSEGSGRCDGKKPRMNNSRRKDEQLTEIDTTR